MNERNTHTVVFSAWLLTATTALAPLAVADPGLGIDGGNCEGSLVRVGLKDFMNPDFSLIVSPHEGYIHDDRNGDQGLFLFEGSPESTLDGASDAIAYLMSGYTDDSHDYCEPIVCSAMEEVSRRFDNLGPNEDPEPLLQEAEDIIGTQCALSPTRPLPAAGP